ncbi:MAG: hypothetical protein QOE11_2674 [Solirubrobacteraceae bacterium]|nr:hypothetical protein [Solirubrobacteraceae bacterium]
MRLPGSRTLRAAALGLLVAMSGAGAVAGATQPAPCSAGGLRAAFRVVAGSAGAGSITYTVRLTNRRARACVVSGRPGLRLLGAHGAALPTAVAPDRPGTGAAALIAVGHGRTAIALARFSPDIPGRGEPAKGRCEHVAHRVRVSLASPGSGSLTGAVSPPTPVCDHGRIAEGLLHLSAVGG